MLRGCQARGRSATASLTARRMRVGVRRLDPARGHDVDRHDGAGQLARAPENAGRVDAGQREDPVLDRQRVDLDAADVDDL